MIYFYSRIDKFKEFSNFYPCKIYLDSLVWPSVEHYYQSQKFPPEDRERVRLQPTAMKAKAESYKSPHVSNWDSIKEDIMYTALFAKFTQNKELGNILLSTGNEYLAEASPSDMYWGYKGKNRLGILLMTLRNHLGGY